MEKVTVYKTSGLPVDVAIKDLLGVDCLLGDYFSDLKGPFKVTSVDIGGEITIYGCHCFTVLDPSDYVKGPERLDVRFRICTPSIMVATVCTATIGFREIPCEQLEGVEVQYLRNTSRKNWRGAVSKVDPDGRIHVEFNNGEKQSYAHATYNLTNHTRGKGYFVFFVANPSQYKAKIFNGNDGRNNHKSKAEEVVATTEVHRHSPLTSDIDFETLQMMIKDRGLVRPMFDFRNHVNPRFDPLSELFPTGVGAQISNVIKEHAEKQDPVYTMFSPQNSNVKSMFETEEQAMRIAKETASTMPNGHSVIVTKSIRKFTSEEVKQTKVKQTEFK